MIEKLRRRSWGIVTGPECSGSGIRPGGRGPGGRRRRVVASIPGWRIDPLPCPDARGRLSPLPDRRLRHGAGAVPPARRGGPAAVDHGDRLLRFAVRAGDGLRRGAGRAVRVRNVAALVPPYAPDGARTPHPPHSSSRSWPSRSRRSWSWAMAGVAASPRRRPPVAALRDRLHRHLGGRHPRAPACRERGPRGARPCRGAPRSRTGLGRAIDREPPDVPVDPLPGGVRGAARWWGHGLTSRSASSGRWTTGLGSRRDV